MEGAANPARIPPAKQFILRNFPIATSLLLLPIVCSKSERAARVQRLIDYSISLWQAYEENV